MGREKMRFSVLQKKVMQKCGSENFRKSDTPGAGEAVGM